LGSWASIARVGGRRKSLESGKLGFAQKFRQLRDIRRNPPRLVARLKLWPPNSNAGFAQPSVKLLDEGASACRIGKAPAIINFALPNRSTSMSRLNVSRMMKLNDPAAQCDIQSVDSDGKLADIT
jgi:hypothetical protein